MAEIQGVRGGEVTQLYANAPHRELWKRQVARTHWSAEVPRSVLSLGEIVTMMKTLD